jgi:5-formyltetrahydrofolate cyclo-ligase
VSKKEIRSEVWEALRAAGAARFPGARGRIPNFTGAEAAAVHLQETQEWRDALTIKCNPDLPQRPIRRAALIAGKTVFMAVPKLAEEAPFLMLDPGFIDPKDYWKASSIKGAAEFGHPVSVSEMPLIDLIVTGCVAVSEDGTRLGKGGGYSDLEYGLLRHFGKVDEETPVATSIHSVQFLEAGEIPREPHDVTIDLVAFADGVRRCRANGEKPSGILWDALGDEKREAIPVLRDWSDG